jgi:serine/threonine-protein kinase
MDISPEQWTLVDALFDTALDCPPGERRDFLHDACDDAEVRAIVLDLLASTEQDSLLDVPVDQQEGAFWERFADALDAAPESAARRGDRVGPYRLGDVVGRGGSGVVYRAERANGTFDQTVALKLLARQGDSHAILDRFTHEQQVLADLTHPNIARLYDGGVTDDGQPYFVMEFVDGEPLDRYCDDRQLPIDGRLELFTTVAETVHHAHRTLVVHRDLKPSNILVLEDGTPKLLDFGIAKVLGEEAPGLTRTGERWMTPEYAAPEQVTGAAITTGTDVYQLGVVLYELLTGHRPYRPEARSVYEIEQAVCEDTPTRPSTVVARTVDADDDPKTPEAVSEVRGTDPVDLQRTLRGDLDAIILKALRKEPEARYGSAEALVEDVRRYLDGRPVEAHRGSWTYRAQKFVRRHAVGVSTAVAVLLLALGAGLFHTQRVTAERDRAQLEAETSARVTTFLVNLFQQSSPFVTPTDTVTLRDVLAGAEDDLERLNAEPAIQARLFATLGDVYQNLGRYERSERLLEQALTIHRRAHGDQHPETASAMANLAWTLKDVGAYERADSLLGRALSVQQANPDTPDSLLATSYNSRGVIAFHQSRYDAAASWHEEALALRRELYPDGAPPLAYSLYNLAITRHQQGALPEADSLYREALDVARTHLSPKHPETTRILRDLGRLRMETGQHDAAAPLLNEVLAINRDVLGTDHPRITTDLNNLAILHVRRGDPTAAEPLFRDALRRRRAQLGSDHPYVATSLNNLAYTLKEQGEVEAAIPLYREAVRVAGDALGAEHVNTSIFRYNLGTMLHRNAQHSEAERLYRTALANLQTRLPSDHPRIGNVHAELGRLLTETKRAAEAESHLRTATRIRQAQLGPDSKETAQARFWLGTCLLRQEKTGAEAESLLVGAHDALQQLEEPSLLRKARRELVALYRAQNRPQEAQQYRDLLDAPVAASQ